MGSDTADPTRGTLNLLGAGAYVLQAILSVIATIFGILSIFVSSLPVIIFALIVTAGMMPWVRYHDRWIEQAEIGMRSTIFPAYNETVREFLNLFRRIYNPLICWWNAFNWWGYGMIREVLFPTIRMCGIKQLLINVAYFVEAVAEDFLLHIVSGAFWNTDADYSRVSTRGIAMFQEWVNLYSCMCADLKDILGAVPFLSPVIVLPPLWPVFFFSTEWLDPQTWCFIGNLFNAGCAALREFLRLVQQVLYLIFGQPLPGGVFIRPDLRDLVNRLCPAVACFIRSTENAYQVVWDLFVPFPFVFKDYLCIVDSIICILMKTVGLLFRILVNIDKCVLYPTDDFWESVIKADMIEIINLYVAPTDFADARIPRTLTDPVRYIMKSYYLDPLQEYTKTGKPNPIFGLKHRLSECICIFIQRTICDPSDTSTGCFSQGAQNLLMGLDFCCATDVILKVLADVVTFLIEFSLHLAKGPDDFFLFIDHQPFTTVFKDDLTLAARCLFSIFGLIPVVGTCIRDLLVGIVRYLLCLADFFTRVVIGLLTLPYFLIVLPSIDNFLYAANLAQDFFIQIHDDLIADVPGSVKNCLCVILNNAFPVPPIPCSSCVVSGYVPPPAFKRHRTFFDPVTKEMVSSPWSIMLEIWGTQESIFQVTPLLSYGKNHTTNPITLFNRAFDNIQHGRVTGLPNLASVNDMVNQKKEELKDRWFRVKSCRELHAEARELKVKNRAMYEYNLRRGKYDCREEESFMPSYAPPTQAAGVRANDQQQESKLQKDTLFTDESGATLAPHAGENATEKEARLTLGTTLPTLVGCDPAPPCFDLCCIVRSTLIFLVHLVQFITRFFNGIILGSASKQGTLQDYPYFTGEFANFGQHTFESDIVQLVLDLFVPIRCACQVLNLIIPVVPSAFSPGRPDICCFVQRISELIACIIMVIINSISALAMGDVPGAGGFGYFTMGFFKSDVNTLFDISLEVVVCLCVFVRAIFPLNFIPGFAEATNFDICCIGVVLLDTIIEIVRLIFQIVISLATITVDPSSYCYWRLDQTSDHMCGGTLDQIGVIKQLDVVINTFLPQSGESDKGGNGCLKNCGNDNGSSGIVPCICQIINTLVPYRRDPSKATNCLPKDDPNSNCQLLDLCCFFSKLGFTISDSLKFINRGFAALWQSWEGGLPEFFIHYVWCAEERIPPCPDQTAFEPSFCSQQVNVQIPQCAGVRPVLDQDSMIQYRCGQFTCGKLNIVIKDIADPFEGLFARCLCQLFGLLDALIALLFNLIRMVLPLAGWSCCFCGGANEDGTCTVNDTSPCGSKSSNIFKYGSGVLPAVAYIVQAALKALVGLLRQFPLSCYWKPAGGRVPAIIRDTWIFSFLAPTADALCIASGNLMCFVNSMFLLPQVCQRFGSRFLGSVVRWVAEIILRVVGFIEAFVQSFISSPNTCVGPTCDQKAGSKEQTAKGVNAKPLGNMLVILLSIPTDLLIGDADVACTTLCPSILALPKPDACGCWNRSPAYGGGANITGPYVPDTGVTNSSICLDPATGEHVGARFGQTRGCCVLPLAAMESGLKSPLPICQSPDDINVVVPTVNVTYNELYNISYVKPNFNYTGTQIQFETPIFPGSCVAFGACRADALPSCANDPETPPGLSAQYVGALDGLVMGFLKYLRCLLNNLLGCQANGTNCTKLGIIFYPAILIFSISWQILGGVIRFIASTIIFLFSLFTPPTGGACTCWDHPELDGWNQTIVQYFDQVGGLCYNCNILGHECNKNIPVGTVSGDDCSDWLYPCAKWCPYNQQLLNPTFTAAQAMQACIGSYGNFSHVNQLLTAEQACSGHILNLQMCDVFSDNVTRRTTACVNYFDPTVVAVSTGYPLANQNITQEQTFSNPPTGLCNLYIPQNGPWGNFALNPRRAALIDACPDPHCQFNAPPHPSPTLCGQTGIRGFWPCGNNGPFGLFKNSYPANPLVVCGVLQIISNFLDIWTAFADIFTTPLLIPPTGKRGAFPFGAESAYTTFLNMLRSSPPSGRGRPYGPPNREPRQEFNKRFDGTLFGLDNSGGTNMVEATAEALFNYDVSDCYSDPVTCACRNFDISAHCSVDSNGQVVFGHKGRKRDGTTMNANDMNQMLDSELFGGDSVCDHTIKQVAYSDFYNMTEDHKNRYVSCMDKKVQGSRLQQVADIFPDDIMYNSKAPMTLIHNVFHTVRTGLNKRHAVRQQQVSDAREEMEQRFPRFQEQLNQRMLFARQVLQEDYGITHESLIFDAAVRADQVWFKYQTGFYNFALDKTIEGIASGRSILPSTQEALADMGHAAWDLKNIIVNQRYGHLYATSKEAVTVAARYTSDLLDAGIMQSMKQGYARHLAFRQLRIGRASTEQTEAAKRAFFASPLVKWWYDTPREERLLTPFIDHMYRVIAFQREHWQTQSLNAFNADLKFWSLKDIFTTRWSKGPQWTPQKLQNIERAKRVYYQVQERIWPGSVTPHERERFLFLNNCVVVDKAVNLTLKVVDYCANEAMPNLDFVRVSGRNRALGTSPALRAGSDSLQGIIIYLRDVSPYRAESFYGYENRRRFVEEPSAPRDPHSWIRPRLKTSFNVSAYESGNYSFFASTPLRGVDARVYRANSHRSPMAMEVHGPANFNLFDWLIVVIEDWFGYALGSQADTWFDTVKQWFTNDLTDVKLWPQSNGLKFFIYYLPSCPFPEGTNCSIGIGFEYAFYWCTLGLIGVIIIGSTIFPPILIPFSILSFGISYAIILFMVAWFFPPGCWFTLPLPSLPSCAYDQLMAFLDKWITNCYSPLILPSYMIAGEVCPTDPNQSIDFLNCRDVGVSDGIQNLLYAGYWIFGQPFCDFMIYISSTSIGLIIPGLPNYISVTLNDFKTSSDTNKQRLTFCFWATLPTILFPAAVVFVGGLVLALIIPPLLLLINALITFFMASPAAGIVPGADASVWYGENPTVGNEEEEELEYDDYPPAVKTDASFRGVMNRAIYGKIKVE